MRKSKVWFLLLTLMLILVAAALLSACDGKSRKIEFLIDGETYYETTVKDGTVVTIPQIDRTEDLTFKGWYLDGELYREESVTVDRDMTFEAVWLRDYYDIYYVIYDGRNNVLNPKHFGRGTVVDLYEPTRNGYTFVGWYLEGEKIEKITDETFKNSNAESITLFSEWEPVQYTVSLDAQGGDLEEEELTVTYGDVSDFPVPEKYGYAFEGWYDGYERVTDGKGKCLSIWTYTEDLELTAKWKIDPSKTGLSIYPSDTGYVLYSASGFAETLIVPDYVTEIGEYAFNSNSTCTELLFAEGSKLTVVEDHAFFKSKIKNIVLPAGVVSIGDSAFASCTELESVAFADGSKLNHIGEGVFKNCHSLKSAVLPSSVREIPSQAFGNCYSLYEFGVSEGCRYISERAFENCYVLASLTLSSTVEYIGDYAFSDCQQLKEIYNLSDLPLVEGDTSYGLVASRAVDIYDNTDVESKVVVTTDGFVFYDGTDGAVLLTALNRKGELILPQSYEGGVYSIGREAFYDCEYTSVVIPDAVTEIGESAFCYCTSLGIVTIGAGVAKIGDKAFAYCSDLYEVKLSENSALTVIGTWAFNRCSSLTSFTVPQKVVIIGSLAFEKCELLSEVINLSSLNIVAGSEEYGGIALYAEKVITSLE